METIESLKAEINRLKSAWQVEILVRKDAIIAKQEAENDRLKAELKSQQSPAVVVPDWVIDAIERQFCSEIDCATPDTSCCMKDLKDSVNFLRGMSVEPIRQRVTEQDARAMWVSAFRYWMNNCDRTVYNWIEDEGRALLAKLNGVEV